VNEGIYRVTGEGTKVRSYEYLLSVLGGLGYILKMVVNFWRLEKVLHCRFTMSMVIYFSELSDYMDSPYPDILISPFSLAEMKAVKGRMLSTNMILSSSNLIVVEAPQQRSDYFCFWEKG
jgi:hypothetical protein